MLVAAVARLKPPCVSPLRSLIRTTHRRNICQSTNPVTSLLRHDRRSKGYYPPVNERGSVSGIPCSLFSGMYQPSAAFSVRTLTSQPNISSQKSSRKIVPNFETLTLWEQMRSFPSNVKKLYIDALTYLNIESAARTSRNAWGGRVPRRQRAFQRWMEKEVGKVALPVVGYVVIPVLGNIFIVLAVSFPRIMLSQHFLSEQQIRLFAADEFAYETKYNRMLGEYVDSTLQTNYVDIVAVAKKAGLIETSGSAGPTFTDALFLYDKTFGADGEQSALADFSRLPRPHLLALAHATGAVPPPHFVTTPLFDVLPSALIARRIDAVASELVSDDFLLIEEGHHRTGCVALTEKEVLDCCLARCLPTLMTSTSEEMRLSLTDHLNIVSQLKKQVELETEVREAGEVRNAVNSFVMHLPAIRLWLKERTGH